MKKLYVDTYILEQESLHAELVSAAPQNVKTLKLAFKNPKHFRYVAATLTPLAHLYKKQKHTPHVAQQTFQRYAKERM